MYLEFPYCSEHPDSHDNVLFCILCFDHSILSRVSKYYWRAEFNPGNLLFVFQDFHPHRLVPGPCPTTRILKLFPHDFIPHITQRNAG